MRFIAAKIVKNAEKAKGEKQKNPAVTSGILCKQFRRLIMMFYHFFFVVSSSAICLSFLLPPIST